MRHLIELSMLSIFVLAPGGAPAQVPAPVSPKPGQILISGTVPDEASKAAMLARLRELYGADRVVDQIAIGNVSLPPNWSGYVQKLIGPDLKLISKGQLKIDGNNVSVRGEVANEAQRQQVASDFATSLNPTYTVNNGGADAQDVVDGVGGIEAGGEVAGDLLALRLVGHLN